MGMTVCPRCKLSFIVGLPAVHYVHHAVVDGDAKLTLNKDFLAKSRSTFCRVLRQPAVVTTQLSKVTCKACLKKIRNAIGGIGGTEK